MVWIPTELRSVHERVLQGQTPRLTVRTLLSWFSSERRGSRVVSNIHAALRELAMTTKPNFEDAWIDGEILFLRAPTEARPASVAPPAPDAGGMAPPAAESPTEPAAASDAAGAQGGGSVVVADAQTPSPAPEEQAPQITVAEAQAPPIAVVEPAAQRVPNARHDPVFRLGKLAAANRTPTTASPATRLEQAITVMMLHDFSQLPVITSVSRIEGAVSWKSIAQAYALRQPPVLVSDCLAYAPVYQADDSVFEALDDISQHGFTLVISQKKLQGIVTLTDVASEFRGSFEPFVLIGEIERHLRRLIDLSLPLELIQSLCGASEPRSIESASDLSFGQYRRILERPEVWERCGLRVDRVETIKRLDQLREIRNEMMHFQSEAISDENMRDIRAFAVFLREVLR